MFIRSTLGCWVALMFVFAGGHAGAQSSDNKEISAAGACTDLDFMAGHWRVHGSAGGPIDATLRVEISQGHCYATQYWERKGGHGICFIAYGNQQHDWAQSCGGFGNGERYRFSGGKLSGSEVRFAAEDMVGGVTRVLSVFNLPDGRVRELVKESADGGKTWKTIDDVYWSRM
jgi:hypothetical protein